jgi:hypothetical protein
MLEMARRTEVIRILEPESSEFWCSGRDYATDRRE